MLIRSRMAGDDQQNADHIAKVDLSVTPGRVHKR